MKEKKWPTDTFCIKKTWPTNSYEKSVAGLTLASLTPKRDEKFRIMVSVTEKRGLYTSVTFFVAKQKTYEISF